MWTWDESPLRTYKKWWSAKQTVRRVFYFVRRTGSLLYGTELVCCRGRQESSEFSCCQICWHMIYSKDYCYCNNQLDGMDLGSRHLQKANVTSFDSNRKLTTLRSVSYEILPLFTHLKDSADQPAAHSSTCCCEFTSCRKHAPWHCLPSESRIAS